MAEYVLVSDPSLSYEYREFSLLDFLPCAPSNRLTEFLFPFLRGPRIPNDNGRAVQAPYALRKIEAALLQEFTEEEVVVAHPDYVDRFIDERTKIIGVHTMDPIGLGPVTMMYTNGRTATSLVELFSAVMSMPVTHMNPTRGRISIPAGYPELIQKLSQIIHAGPDKTRHRWPSSMRRSGTC